MRGHALRLLKQGGFHRRAAAAAAFDPATLSPALWLVASPTYCFTDAGATVPAAADNDHVQVWKDKSGNGRDLSQATDASRPLYVAAGGVKGNAGGSRRIRRAGYTWPTEYTAFVAYTIADPQDGRLFGGEDAADGDNGTGYLLGFGIIARNAGSVADLDAAGDHSTGRRQLTVAVGSAVSPNVLVRFDGDDGTEAGNDTISSISAPSPVTLLCSSLTPTGNSTASTIHEFLLFDGRMTAANIAHVESYLAALYGPYG